MLFVAIYREQQYNSLGLDLHSFQLAPTVLQRCNYPINADDKQEKIANYIMTCFHISQGFSISQHWK